MATANLAYESDPLGGEHEPNAHVSPKILVMSCHLQACGEIIEGNVQYAHNSTKPNNHDKCNSPLSLKHPNRSRFCVDSLDCYIPAIRCRGVSRVDGSFSRRIIDSSVVKFAKCISYGIYRC